VDVASESSDHAICRQETARFRRDGDRAVRRKRRRRFMVVVFSSANRTRADRLRCRPSIRATR